MASTAIEEIEEWSSKLSPWRRDCLRRLASTGELGEEDAGEVLAVIKKAAGFELDVDPPEPIPFTKADYGGSSQTPVTLKGIANIKGVNRLKLDASINFCPSGLTVVYGRNGSGKSGYVRILRTACRTRVENASKLKVLGDVYGPGTQPLSADIIIDTGAGDVPVSWTPDCKPGPELSQVAVFDSASAQLNVDGGNQIRYLPFGLALPHRLNAVGLDLRSRIESERSSVIGNKVALSAVAFGTVRSTGAQLFERSVVATTTDEQIANAAKFESTDQARLDEISTILSSGSTAIADLGALITWTDGIALECEGVSTALSEAALPTFTATRQSALTSREAAQLAATALFTDEPLAGVGSESWRKLWSAARDYSVTEAYPGQDFPVVTEVSGKPACVLCQQTLEVDGAARMERFRQYMDDTLDVEAKAAEQKLENAISTLPSLPLLGAGNFVAHVEQVRQRDASLADDLIAFQSSAAARRKNALGRLQGDPDVDVTPLTPLHTQLSALTGKLQREKQALIEATDETERAKLLQEKTELEDRKVLAANQAKLTTRRDLLRKDAAYAKAIAELQPKGITERANRFVDDHLTTAVVDRFNVERDNLDISHLKIGLQRKSGQVKAEFHVDPQTTLTKIASDILSEGEQRALALAGFLTEVALTEGSGPIIVDDPVSSLDRDRSLKVADRLADEAKERQVIVFTHDIIFFNELCAAADEKGIEPVTVAIFSDGDAAGKIDPAGMVWKGLNVAKRIGKLKNDLAPIAKFYTSSPSDYEYQVKNLYGRLRDTYERVVEEIIFKDIVRRGADVIQTQLLRYITLPDPLAIRFHEGMTLANTHSHDNPASGTVLVRTPDQFKSDIAELEKLVEDFKAAQASAEAARPEMKPKK
jgi:hypothetical protein